MGGINKKSLLYPAVFMLVLSGLMTLVLAFVNAKTGPIVERNQELELRKKILNIFQVDTNIPNEEIHEKFEIFISETGQTFNDEPIYQYKDGEKLMGYAVSAKGSGYIGPVEAYFGITPDMAQVLGVEFISQGETPGLGGRIEEDEYKEQYRNIPVESVGEEIDAISGATNTSRSVLTLITSNLQRFIEEGGVQ